MSVFGPFYPADLQSAVNHAERFARVVARKANDFPRRRSAPVAVDERSRAELWLEGRADEIHVVVGDVVDEWRVGLLSPRRASVAIDAYLLALHRAMASFGREGDVPACCRPSEATVDADVDALLARATA